MDAKHTQIHYNNLRDQLAYNCLQETLAYNNNLHKVNHNGISVIALNIS